MKIEVKMTNITPVFSAAPGSEYVSLDGVFNPPPSLARFPVTRCRQMPVIADVGEGVLKQQRLPIVPGNTMRNLLRRTILKNYIEPVLIEQQQSLSIGAYAAAYAGSASGNPDGMVDSFDEIAGLRNHQFLGLFGGGPRMLEGRLKVDNLYPIHRHALRILGEDHINDAISGSITNLVWSRRNDPVLAITEKSETEVITHGTSAVNSWITDLAKKPKTKGTKGEQGEEGEEEGERGLKAFNAHEVVIPGVSWLWRISLDNPTPAQVGLVLLAISKLNNESIAGGHAKDYGRITLDSITVDGEQCWDATGFANVDSYLDHAVEALDATQAADFEEFAASKKPNKREVK